MVSCQVCVKCGQEISTAHELCPSCTPRSPSVARVLRLPMHPFTHTFIKSSIHPSTHSTGHLPISLPTSRTKSRSNHLSIHPHFRNLIYHPSISSFKHPSIPHQIVQSSIRLPPTPSSIHLTLHSFTDRFALLKKNIVPTDNKKKSNWTS